MSYIIFTISIGKTQTVILHIGELDVPQSMVKHVSPSLKKKKKIKNVYEICVKL